MNTELFYKPALIRVINFVNSNKGPYKYEDIALNFYNNVEEVDKAPKTERKLNLDSPNKKKVDSTPVEVQVTPIKENEGEEEVLPTNDVTNEVVDSKEFPMDVPESEREAKTFDSSSEEKEKKNTHKTTKKQSKDKVEESKVERSTTPNIPPPDPKKEEESTEPNDIVVKWFDKKRNYVRDVKNNNILKLMNDEYILIGRYDPSCKSLKDIGKEELLNYNGNINVYEYDNNYFVPTVNKASKPPTV